MIRLAAARYLRMLKMAEDPKNEFYFSPRHVIDYCGFAEQLQHIESGLWEFEDWRYDEDGGIDKRIILEPWQIWIESAIHGFRNRLNGTRLVTKALELIPRKNGKTLKLAPAALFDICCSGQLAAQTPICATTEKQADDTLFGAILKMVKQDEELQKQYKLKVTNDEITCGLSRIWKLHSIGERLDGLNPSLALFEEGHSGAASVYKVIMSAFGARPNALLRMITTAGYKPEGPAWELYKQAQGILNGKGENYTIFAAIYELDREDYLDGKTNAILFDKLFKDERLIFKANPMYGISLDPVKIRNDMNDAKVRADLRGELARTRFNIWTGSGVSLVEPHMWAACEALNLDIANFFGKKCWIGVDLAQVLDMCAIVLVFEMTPTTIAVFAKFFLPAGSPTVQDPDMFDQFHAWANEGWLELTPGTMADHDKVRAEIEAYCDLFDVQVISCDPHQAHNTAKHLWDGNRPIYVYPNNQKTMTPPTDDILGRIVAQRIVHDGNPVLAWNMQNVHGERKGNGLILPRKEDDNSKRKIDGFVALCFANGYRIDPNNAKEHDPDQPMEDPYLTRGIIGYQETANV